MASTSPEGTSQPQCSPSHPQQQDPSTSNGDATVPTFRIGTRRSLLARVQADEVANMLRKAWPGYRFEIVALATAGDKDKKTALYKFNEKSLWTQDLEVLLQAGELDLIQHCLKDMPTQLPNDLELSCVTPRHDPRDALVIKASLADKYKSLADLPAGSVVGTSSLRRLALLKRFYPHLAFADVRGNIDTRLAKLDNPESEYSAIVLAAAGLARLGMQNRIATYLSKNNGGMLYAVGQGALGLEIRAGDERVKKLLEPIVCHRSMRAGLVERSLMRTLEGGCSVPIGVETEWVSKKASLTSTVGGVGVGIKPAEDYHQLSGSATGASETIHNSVHNGEDPDGLTDELIIRAIVISLDGQDVAEVETRRRINSIEEADEFGWSVAKMLVDQGADRILKQINLDRGIIAKQDGA